jgi:TATA-binding protein-associated factor
MIRQDSVLTLQNGNSADPEQSHVWEVRHAGLLGIKYEVAVRSDLFDWTPKQEGATESPHVLKDVVDAAILGLVVLVLYFLGE